MSIERDGQRITINKEFESFDVFFNDYITNVSKSGVFVRSTAPLEVGTEVSLRFTVIMDGVHTIEGKGEVVRVETNPPGNGVVSTELTRYSQAIIERLLMKQREI